MKMSKIFFGCMLAAVFSLTSCIKENLDAGLSDGDEVIVTLTTDIENITESQSRALSNDQEQKLQKVKIVAFNNSNNYLYVRDGNVSNNTNTTGTDGSGTATIRFGVPPSATQVNFVVIANADNEVMAAIAALPSTFSKSTFLGRAELVKSLSGNNAWTTTGTYAPIPMYGEVSTPTTGILRPRLLITSGLNLTRMLARINVVATSISPTTSTGFQLTSVRLFNINRAGHIVSGLAPAGTGAGQLNPLSYPSASNCQSYTLSPAPTLPADNKLTNTIYAFQRDAGTTPVVLIVGGKYGGSSSTETFYRVDLRNSSSAILGLARNTSYNVTISSVLGHGYPSVDAAYNSTPMNMTASTTAVTWEDSDVVVFDKTYAMGVSPRSFNFDNKGQSGTITIKTSETTLTPTVTLSGSPTDITSAPAWLTKGTLSGSSPTFTNTITVTPNTGTTLRTGGYVHITVGRLKYVVPVQQRNVAD